MSGLALEVAVNRWLKPAFEAASPYRLEIDWRPTTAIMKSIAEGRRADVVIATDVAIDQTREAVRRVIACMRAEAGG